MDQEGGLCRSNDLVSGHGRFRRPFLRTGQISSVEGHREHPRHVSENFPNTGFIESDVNEAAEMIVNTSCMLVGKQNA